MRTCMVLTVVATALMSCGSVPNHQAQRATALLDCSRFFVETNGEIGRSFILRSSEHCSLIPRSYLFDELIIEQGASATVIDGSRSWLILDVVGTARIDGLLRYEGFLDRQGEITANTPRHGTISYAYPRQARGGNGDGGLVHGENGGVVYRCSGGPRAGYGAAGSTDYGGGGGAAPNRHEQGQDAEGAAPGGRPIGGGRGGLRRNTRNGGLVFLASSEDIAGNGRILLNGSVGENGSVGNTRRCGWNTYGPIGVAGSGGGGPGGDGGYLRLVAPRCSNSFEVQVFGGRGGEGGRASQYSAADDGETGANGFVDYDRCGSR